MTLLHKPNGALSCEYPPCHASMIMPHPSGLCPEHRQETAFVMWLLEKKMRLGQDGPTVLELLSLLKTVMEQGAVQAAPVIVTPNGEKPL